ncbi:uncharacterized protein LOC131942421 [Physella acuta]|uniref:uncharacterized protein LOC131942421 n=1 Tax=Physella acuta TaxID=109671 RepID=UPI0027DD6C2C|nr:uncharacterized protein LOC131942421 [Physella acuta]
MNHLTYQLLILTLIAGHCGACNSRSSSRSYNSAPTIVCPSFPAILMTAKGDVTRNISWAVPNAYDDNGTPRFYQSEGLPSGSIFSEGSHTIRYIATDYYGSSGACTVSFRLKVRRCRADHLTLANGTVHCHDAKAGNVYGSRCQYGCDPGYRLVGSSVAECQENETWSRPKPYCKEKVCRKLPPPENGAVTCHSVNRTSRTCLPQCVQDMVLHDVANRTYTCSDLSEVWSPKDFIPRCMAPRRPQDVMTSPSFYYYSRDCSSDVSVVREKFLTALSGLQLVGAGGKCDVTEVVVTCGKHVTVRHTAGEHLSQYKMTATLRVGVYRNQGTPTGSYKFYSSVVESLGERLSKASSAGDLDLPGVGRFGELDQGQVKFTCEPGTRMVYDVMACVGCGQGYIYDTKTDKCRECPKDTYQDQDIGFTCKPCPTGTTTVYMGSVSLKQCQGHCPAGHYSDTGMTPCQKCPAGTHQSERGMHVCDLCPFGMSTPQTGATSGQDCQFVAVRLDENSPGPVLEVKDESPVTFTFMAWLSADVNHTRSRLRFSLEHSTVNWSCAGLVLGHVTICLDTDVTHDTNSSWSHLAVTCNGKGQVTLYENGKQGESYLYVDMTTWNKINIQFQPSDNLTSVVVSGLQMTRTEYTDVHVGTFARSCLAQVDDNILGARHGDTLNTSANTCTVPVAREWSKWGQWSVCDVTCGHGARTRTRKCENQDGGDCYGADQETEVCRVADCARRRPNDVMTSPSFYYYSGNCSSDVSVVKDNFLTALSGLDLLGADGKVDVREVKVTCGKHVQQRELTSLYKVTAVVHVGVYQQRSGPWGSGPRGSYKFYNSVVDSLNHQLLHVHTSGNLDLPGVGRLAELEQGQAEFTCDPGTRLEYDVMACAGCGQGYIYDTKTDKCRECPKDTYQDQDIGFTCKQCPKGTATVSTATVSLKLCQDFCSPGHYSDTGTRPCQTCPPGSYQPQDGGRGCRRCPYGMSTPTPGARSRHECQFVAVSLNENSPGPVLEVKDDSPVTFTFMAWLSADVNHTRSRLRFSLEHSTVNTSCAGLALGHVTFCLDTDVTNATSDWSHVAVVYTKKGELTLYENGNLVGSYLEEIKTCNNMAIKFKSSAHLKSVLVSGLQMTRTEYTDVHVGTFARSCLAQVDDNILGARPGVVLKAAPGSCTVPDLQGWMKWGLWSPCDVTCGQGTRSRSRKCRNAHPEKGGGRCTGEGQEAEVCHAPPCGN